MTVAFLFQITLQVCKTISIISLYKMVISLLLTIDTEWLFSQHYLVQQL